MKYTEEMKRLKKQAGWNCDELSVKVEKVLFEYIFYDGEDS